ncbi:glycoside hydrolase family 13 protein [Trametopsis cervina]|nr:glycoside hydrolase family 13 protein [Trametopsis cervina]
MRGLLPVTVLGSAVAVAAHPNMRLHRRSAAQPIIVQMFEWSWASVGAECSAFIGPAGYQYVQVSTASEHIQGSQWWTSYQKVSNTIQSKRGSRQDFANMVSACNAAGVQVIVDTVLNHMAGIDSGTGVAGTGFTHYSYNGLYSTNDFHYCGTDGNDIQDWNNKWQIQNCELSNLADLATETDHVRQTLVDHANDLLSLGVAGFRLDAAKHIPIDDLQNIVSRLSRKPYITSEVIGGGQPIPPSDYTPLGTVTISDSFAKIEAAFTGAGLTSLENWESGNGVPSDSATVFVATHDSERGGTGGSLNYKSANNAYTLANVFLLAYPYGTPTILSSYSFDNGDDGAPNGGNGACSGASGQNGFLCQHRWTAIANMARFRSVVGTAPLQNWQAGTADQVAFDRGSSGFVAINNAGSTWSATLTTALPDGAYCDVVSGSASGGACTGEKLTVSGGKVSVSIPAYAAFAIHTGAKL